MLTAWLDLRGGRPPWRDADESAPAADPLPDEAGIAIVGAGVMGAMLAERLARDGHDVVVLDRRAPARGATAASTALVLWAADVPLVDLASRVGIADAAYAWRRVHRAVTMLSNRIGGDAALVGWRKCPELYLAASLLDEEGLRSEARLRAACGLQSRFVDRIAVADRFGLPPRAALLSDASFAVDPVALTHLLLARARAAGGRLCYPHDVQSLNEHDGRVELQLADGRAIRAGRAVLATGYESARAYLPRAFGVGSSFAIATAPGTAFAWREDAMIWEAAAPYLYVRRTSDGRIIIGGEDIDGDDPNARDALLADKRTQLEAKGAELLGLERVYADCAWAASFGTSPDGLPAIGRARDSDHIWLAYGFGGNGISFAALASDLIADDLAGAPDRDASLFDPYRGLAGR